MLGKWTALAAGFSVAISTGAAQADAPDLKPHAAVVKKKKKRRVPVFSGYQVARNQFRAAPLDRPSGHIELFAVNFQEHLVVDIYDQDGDYNEEALDQLNHVLRCKRTGTEKAIDPRLFETLSRIYDHFGRELELVSGYRNQKRESSYHFHGSASDVRIPGVPDKVLHQYVASLDTGNMGLGIYPRAGFIHVDVRPTQSYRWVDNSPPGTQDMGHPKKKKGARIAAKATATPRS